MISTRQQYLCYKYRYFWYNSNIDRSRELYTLFWKHLVDKDKIIKENKNFVSPVKLDKDKPLPKDSFTWDDNFYYNYKGKGRYLKDYCYISGCSSQT